MLLVINLELTKNRRAMYSEHVAAYSKQNHETLQYYHIISIEDDF